MIISYKDLQVHKKAFSLAMDTFWRTRKFPKKEIYSLTSQIVRSLRSDSANISEGWGKPQYAAVFKQQLINALGSNSETQDWLDYALAFNYIEKKSIPHLLKVMNK
ncbi:four helix bundle protein [Aequorivita xiaoshiensis]|uniref:Four helix bundle protein n=1 Tax=Aequorivita xiaoshiensis TaxID=2874476 RepID=A0A9X1QYN6_9FLAO|nr:four helix bundle protein [Aequorivita xiaoshiensis]MCG2431091.1 four helix bundle protein [Aequorivita xiaoshiensis]